MRQRFTVSFSFVYECASASEAVMRALALESAGADAAGVGLMCEMIKELATEQGEDLFDVEMEPEVDE